MQSKMEKLVQGIKKGPAFLKELREFDALVKSIGECKSKAEEDRIITQELEVLKQRLSDPKLDKTRGREYMVRAIYCEMLGHDASFAYIKALQFASDPNIHTKKAAYLALTQFLDYNNNLVLLLVNTLLSDLKSDNYLIVNTALVAATKLIGPDLINAVLPVVVERLHHPKEHVRKKAVLALHWFSQLDPRREGPLTGVELERHFRTMLCDKDPAVMSAALCALHDCVKVDPRPFKNLIPSFTSILKQVSEHRLPKTYDYHRFPAPFIQIKLLKILAALGAGDRSASENMYAVVAQTLRRANTSHAIGSALIFECVRTITTIYPNPQLLAAAAESIAVFLRSSSHNLRYVGIDALAGITGLNPAAAAEHQVAVLDCLEDPDDTLKLKTLELLYKMTKANNIQVIVDKMMGYLASCSDEHIRKDIVRKVSDLAERYAPSPSWFVSTISEVFRLGGEHVDEAASHGLVRLIAEQDEGLHAQAVEAYLGLLDGAATAAAQQAAAAAGGPAPKPAKKLPETILLVICWVLGEYGHLARRPPATVLSRLLSVLTAHRMATDRVRGVLLAALAKLAAHTGGAAGPVGAELLRPHGAGGEAAEFLHKCLSSQSLELQQRAHELIALLKSPPTLLAAALPPDASCEEFTGPDLQAVSSLPFLEAPVQRALAAGAAPYLPAEARGAKAADAVAKGLRFEAYEPAPYAVTLGATSTSVMAGGSDARLGPASAAPSFTVAGSAASSSSATAMHPAAAPQEPQLLAAKAGARKWGPAQYDGSGDYGGAAAAAAAPAPSGPSSTSASRPSGVHHGRSASGSAAAGAAAAERERLAASLFGGGPGPAAAAASGRSASQPHGRQGNGAAAAPAAARPAPPPSTNVMDLLMDLDAPAPPPAAARPHHGGGGGAPAAAAGGGDLMDLLGGGVAAAPAPAAAAAGGFGGMGDLLGGMSGMGPGAAGSMGMGLGQAPHQQSGLQGSSAAALYGGGMVGGAQAPYGGMPGMQMPGGPQGMGMGGGHGGQPMGGMGMGMGVGGLPVQQQGMGPGMGMGGYGAPGMAQQQQHQQQPARQPQRAPGPDPFGDLLG